MGTRRASAASSILFGRRSGFVALLALMTTVLLATGTRASSASSSNAFYSHLPERGDSIYSYPLGTIDRPSDAPEKETFAFRVVASSASSGDYAFVSSYVQRTGVLGGAVYAYKVEIDGWRRLQRIEPP